MDPLYGLRFLHLGYHGNGRHFEAAQPPKAAKNSKMKRFQWK
jgi:hypothetical protein